jgi:hypothetical protein
LRKDTLSHAYELMKIDDPKKRKRLTDQVARGELTLLKLRDKIEGRRPRTVDAAATDEAAIAEPTDETEAEADAAWTGRRKAAAPLRDDSLVMAKAQLADAVEAVLDVLRSPDVVSTIGVVDRANLAKYLTIAKLRLENAIAMVRSEGS